MKKSVLRLLFIFFILTGCVQGNRFSTTYAFPEERWQRFENPVLNFNIDKPGIYYDMFLELEYNASQPPADFPVTVLMYTPSGEMRARDIQLEMALPGEQTTSPGKFKVVLRKEFAFSERGACKFEIESRSSRVNTDGVKSISIILERSQ